MNAAEGTAPAHEPKACRSCGAAIYWARKPDGKAFPVDAEPSDRGNIQLYDRGGTVVAKVLGNEEARKVRDAAWALQAKHTLRLAHHVTCPQASSWRKSR